MRPGGEEVCVWGGAKEGRHQQKQRRGVIPWLLVFATRVCGVDSAGAQTGVISGSHRAPLITIQMFCGAQKDRKTARLVDNFHFLLKERAPSLLVQERQRVGVRGRVGV